MTTIGKRISFSIITGLTAMAFLFAIGLASGLGVGAQGGPHGWGMWGPRGDWRRHWGPGHMSPGHRHRMERHWRFMHQGVPAPYKDAKNTLAASENVVDEGGRVYAQHCAQCHGAKGMGDGEAANDVTPSPALLAYLIRRPISVDEYLLWTISEGGRAFDSDMPAFKDVLSREDIWKVISYMRAGFPKVAELEDKAR